MNNIIVWVMVVYSHSGNYVPTLEFTTEQKCIVAVSTIKNYVDLRKSWGFIDQRPAYCIRIEK